RTILLNQSHSAGNSKFPSFQYRLTLFTFRIVQIQMTGQVVQALNIVLTPRPLRSIVKTLLQIERGNRLVVDGDLDTVGAVQCLSIQRNSVLDCVRARELWIHVIWIIGLLTM